ncbi:MAG: HTH domain-containing protein [Streptococcaceae bacterium]|jgi:transcriptional antiterminator|nr:HTH domain-containing protein [Streptococcaceae bacterium]
MYKTRLTPRQISVSIYLLQLSCFVSSHQLAEEFKVSVRTVKTEMEQIRCWMCEQGEVLEARRGKGYRIICSSSRKHELLRLLQSTERQNSPMDQPMRQKQIIIDLFMAKGAVTAAYFSDMLLVSQNTIFNDILQLKKELSKFGPNLKSSHYGYSLDGDEEAIRELVSDLLFAESTNFDVSNLISQFSQGEQNLSESRIIFSNENLRRIYQEVIKLVTENLTVLTDKIENYNILSFIIRLCISIARLKNSKGISTNSQLLSEKELDDVGCFLFRVYKSFGLSALSEEFDYVTAREIVFDQLDIPKFTGQVITEVSKLSGVRFDKDSQLFQNLYTHFSLTFSKGYNLTSQYNPFVNDIKLKRTEMFEFVRQALSSFLPESIEVDDAFVGYAALHFLVSIERENALERDIKVLYVCSTGVGVTSFVQQKVASRIKNIEIAGFSSILNVQSFVKKLKPDLIISVFPIGGLEIPVIEVNALLTENDLQRIQNQVDLLLRAGIGSARSTSHERTTASKDLPVELLVQAFNIYFDLKQLFKKIDESEKLSIEFLEGFLVHVLLMVSRVDNDTQYQDFGRANNLELAGRISAICKAHDLSLNESEISALIPYYEYFDEK